MDALKALWEGALRHMSVPGGAERVKGGMVVVDLDIVVVVVNRRIKVRSFGMSDGMWRFVSWMECMRRLGGVFISICLSKHVARQVTS